MDEVGVLSLPSDAAFSGPGFLQNRSRIYEDPGMEIADLLPQVSHHCPKDVFDHVMVIFAIRIPGDLQFVVSCRFFFRI